MKVTSTDSISRKALEALLYSDPSLEDHYFPDTSTFVGQRKFKDPDRPPPKSKPGKKRRPQKHQAT